MPILLPQTIKAAAKPMPSTLSFQAAAVTIIEAKDDEGTPKRPTFSISGYTGAPISVAGFYSPVIVDLAGLKTTRERIPILLDHDPEKIIGQTDSISITPEGVQLTGTITGDDEYAAKVATHAKNGFEWQASIGASILEQAFLKKGETATVNGRTVNGPIFIFRQSRLFETSFVAMGADDQTSASVAASHSQGTLQGALTVFEKWLQAKGIDPASLEGNDSVRAALQASYDAEQAAAEAAKKGEVKPDPAARQKLNAFFDDQRKETERVDAIRRITEDAAREYPSKSEVLQKLSAGAIDHGADPLEYELEVLRATRATVQNGGGFGIHSSGDLKATEKTIEVALCRNGGLDNLEKHFDARTLEAADRSFKHGLGLCEVLMLAAKEYGNPVSSARDPNLVRAAFPVHIRAQGWSTLSLPGILGNVANKFLSAGFNAVESTWREIAARRSAPDFKAITTYALTGGFMYEKVGAGGELKHATIGEQSYTNQVETYGRMFAITRQSIINDDLGALTQVPKKLGRGAALALNLAFWTAFMNNSTFFTALRSNYIEGAATNLQLSSLTTGETTFMNQTDPDGYPMAITPKILLVPNALSVTAANLMNSTQIANDTTANTLTFATNPHAGKFKVVQSSYLANTSITGNSTTAWYLLADPNDMPVIEVAFLNGRETPIVEDAEADFNTLGIQFRGYLDWGIGLQEYRGGFKSKGAA